MSLPKWVTTAALPAVVAACLAAPAAPAGEAAPAGVPAPERPRIGLVLGGGGAKGAAHIGVLRVLDELHVPVDCVVGTSMGALVGGTFAAGMPPADIEVAVRGINWSKTVGSEGLRDRTPIERKLAGQTYTNGLEFGVKRGALRAPGGLFKSQDIEDVIRNLVSDARFSRDFDNLPIPFRAVATDMLAGEMVVLEKGDLSVAMRASMAVPGAFSPVVIDGRVLSDGGMMRNLPVDIARGLCADVVIAVWLTTPQPRAEDLDSAVALAGRSLDVMIDANQKAQIATLTSSDVGIEVPMGDIGSADFDRVPDAIPLGEKAARAAAKSLERYALPEKQYLAWRDEVTAGGLRPTRLAGVQITGLHRVNPAYVRDQLQNVKPGAAVTTEQITADTGRIFALGDFERVEYKFTGPPDARILQINAVEKSCGPNFVRFDLGLSGQTDGEFDVILRADYDRTWVNSMGGAWHNAVQLGEETLVQSSFYQPIDTGQKFFVEPMAKFDRTLEDIYDDGDRVARYYFRELYGEVDTGANFGTRAQLRAGLRSGWFSVERDIGPTYLPDLSRQRDSSVRARLVYDTRDAIAIPTRGTFLNARYAHSGSWFGGEQDYDLAEGVLTQSFPWRGDSLSFILGGGARLSGELPPTEEFELGGIRTFPGLSRGELRGDSYWYAGTHYLWKLADIQSLFGQALYAGLRLQGGRMGSRIDGVDEGNLYGIAGSLSGRTPIGPFVISLGYVDNSSVELQFALGRPIAEGSILDEIR